MVERPTLVHAAIFLIDKPHANLRRNTSLIFVIDVLFFVMLTSLLRKIGNKDSGLLI